MTLRNISGLRKYAKDQYPRRSTWNARFARAKKALADAGFERGDKQSDGEIICGDCRSAANPHGYIPKGDAVYYRCVSTEEHEYDSYCAKHAAAWATRPH
jgi:hypothetical protein